MANDVKRANIEELDALFKDDILLKQAWGDVKRELLELRKLEDLAAEYAREFGYVRLGGVDFWHCDQARARLMNAVLERHSFPPRDFSRYLRHSSACSYVTSCGESPCSCGLGTG